MKPANDVVIARKKLRKTRIKRSPAEILFDTGNTVFMLLLCLITVYPFWYVLIYSFNTGSDAAMGGIWFWPRAFTLKNYKYVLTNPLIVDAALITIARTVLGSLIHLIVTAMAAYAVSKRNLPGHKYIITFFMIPMFIGGTLISSYIIMSKLKLTNNFLIYILPGAFNFFLMIVIRTFFDQLPEGLEEAAMIDGAGYTRIFLRLIIPLSSPIVATTLFFAAVGHWLDFSTNLIYVTNPKLYTLQFILYRIVIVNDTQELLERLKSGAGDFNSLIRNAPTSQVLKMATLVVITFPIFFVYPFFQRYFIKGILIGSIKG